MAKSVYIVTTADGDVLGVFKTKPNRMKYLKAIGADDPEDSYYMDAAEWADFEITKEDFFN